MGIFNLFRMTEDDGLACLDGRRLCIAEHLFTRGQRELIHQFYLLRLLGIVLDLRLNKYRVAGCIVPDMYAKGFDTYSVCFYQSDRTEDAKGLATLRESPFRITATTHPR